MRSITDMSLFYRDADTITVDTMPCGCAQCVGKRAGSEIATTPGDTIPGTPNPVIVPVGGTLDGWISPDGDTDLLTLNVVAGSTYLVGMNGSGDTPLNDPFLVLYNQDGELVDFDDDGGVEINSLLTFTADYTGVYYVSAEAFSGTGQYTVTVKEETADNVPSTFAGAVELALGSDTFNFIEFSNDIDTYALELVAGQYYNFEVAGGADYNSDWFTLPEGELDTLLALYDSEGNLQTFNDDISFPTDISSRVGFFAQESGTYYLDVFAYPGQTGGYHLVTQEVDLSELDPLDSIDWFSADNVSFTDVNGTPTAYVYFGNSGENFGELGDFGEPMVTIDWNDYEIQQVMLALDEYEKILGVDYQITTDVDEATFRLLKTESQQYGAYFYPQDPAYGDAQGIGVFNVLSGGWNLEGQLSLERGGFSFGVILHEFGHAHGLAHPHDAGGGSDIMLGVTNSAALGVYNLNQGVYTVMSYNDAWQLHPDGPSPFTIEGIDNGWSGSLSAFDIAVLQRRYGVSEYATGNDVYELQDENEQGTFYQTIWDSGGTDAIVYNGVESSLIDLLAATLDYSPTGGGVVSFVDGIWGGYTIAGGVEIENASGGRGDDTILGNALGNLLEANIGDDYVDGRDGADRIYASTGDDTALGGGGDDRIYGETGNDTLMAGDGNDLLDGGAGNDTLNGGSGNDRIATGAGADVILLTALFGDDIVSDFRPGADLLDWSEIGDPLSVAGVGRNTLVDFADGSSVLLEGVRVSQLSRVDWFVDTPVEEPMMASSSALLESVQMGQLAGPELFAGGRIEYMSELVIA